MDFFDDDGALEFRADELGNEDFTSWLNTQPSMAMPAPATTPAIPQPQGAPIPPRTSISPKTASNPPQSTPQSHMSPMAPQFDQMPQQLPQQMPQQTSQPMKMPMSRMGMHQQGHPGPQMSGHGQSQHMQSPMPQAPPGPTGPQGSGLQGSQGPPGPSGPPGSHGPQQGLAQRFMSRSGTPSMSYGPMQQRMGMVHSGGAQGGQMSPGPAQGPSLSQQPVRMSPQGPHAQPQPQPHPIGNMRSQMASAMSPQMSNGMNPMGQSTGPMGPQMGPQFGPHMGPQTNLQNSSPIPGHRQPGSASTQAGAQGGHQGGAQAGPQSGPQHGPQSGSQLGAQPVNQVGPQGPQMNSPMQMGGPRPSLAQAQAQAQQQQMARDTRFRQQPSMQMVPPYQRQNDAPPQYPQRPLAGSPISGLPSSHAPSHAQSPQAPQSPGGEASAQGLRMAMRGSQAHLKQEPPQQQQQQQRLQQLQRQQQQQQQLRQQQIQQLQIQQMQEQQMRRGSAGAPPNLRFGQTNAGATGPGPATKSVPNKQEHARSFSNGGILRNPTLPDTTQFNTHSLETLQSSRIAPAEIRLALGALSVYLQTLKFSSHPPNIKEVMRRVDSFGPQEQRKMVEKFEISRQGHVCETAKLPVSQLLPQVFWSTLSDVYAHIRRPSIPEYVSVGGQNISLFALFQSVQLAGGYLGASLAGRWAFVMRSMNITPIPNKVQVLDLITIYATTLLTFEVYANENEQIRRTLVMKLAPRGPNGAPVAAVPAGPSATVAPVGPGADAVPGPAVQQPFSAAQGTAHVPSQHPGAARTLLGGRPPLTSSAHPDMVAPRVSPGPNPLNASHPTALDANAMAAAAAARGHRPDFPPHMGVPPSTLGKRYFPDAGDGRKRPRLRSQPTSDTFMNFVENGQYMLQRRHSTAHGGRNVRYLTTLGNEVENWRPEVAFPLDLGTVDLNAVTCSLASRDPAEVRQALDKLAVVSANPKVHESLQHCPRLLANLCTLILGMLQQLLKPDTKGDGSQYTFRTLRTTEVDVDVDDVKMIAEGDVAFSPMIDVLKRLRDPVKAEAGEIELGVDPETGNETGEKIERPARNHRCKSSPTTPGGDARSQSLGPEPPVNLNFEPSADKPYYFPSYGTRYERVESEICSMGPSVNEKSTFLLTSLCDRLLLATCVLRNLSFSVANRPVIAHKPEFQRLFWQWLDICGEYPKLLDSELRTLDLCKDFLTVLGNIGLYLRLPNPRDTLKLMLFLLSFSPVESPYTKEGKLKLMDYDIDVHRYLPNAIDVFVKVASREQPNRKQVEEVLLGTSRDPEYKLLVKRWLKAQGRHQLYPAELLTRMFALSVAMMPLTHFRPPSRGIETRQPYLLQGSLAAELLVQMIPDPATNEATKEPSGDVETSSDDVAPVIPGFNIATSWLNSSECFGTRIVRTLNFMGMVVVNQGDGEPQRPFAKMTQRLVGIVQRLFNIAKSDPNIQSAGIVPSIEHLLGGLMASKMDKVVVKHLSALYDEGFAIQEAGS